MARSKLDENLLDLLPSTFSRKILLSKVSEPPQIALSVQTYEHVQDISHSTYTIQ